MENTNENKNPQETSEQQAEGYVSRPPWQVWGARIGLVIFIGFVILQYLTIARGGL